MEIVGRERLLKKLLDVSPGLAVQGKEEIVQSASFAFSGGWVATYNEEVMCKAPTGLPKGFSGVVKAKPLLKLLQKLTAEELRVETSDTEFILSGGRERVRCQLDKALLLPLSQVEKPVDWRPLDPDFTEAVAVVRDCAGRDLSMFAMTCVHVHPDWVEATDDTQLARYRMTTGVTQATLVRATAIQAILTIEPKELSETENWLHFRASDGTRVACHRFSDVYDDLTHVLEQTGGRKVTLPKVLGEKMEAAEIALEDADDKIVRVELRGNRMRVEARGMTTSYSVVKEVIYSGPPLKFLAKPKLLAEVIKRQAECLVTEDWIMAGVGRWTWYACLEKKREEDQQ